MVSHLKWLKDACALIEAKGKRGTGYLIAPNLAATCAHVVDEVGVGGRALLFFNEGPQMDSTVIAMNDKADCALLELASAVKIDPLPLASRPAPFLSAWVGFGFPAIASRSGLVFTGTVDQTDATDPAGAPAIQLHSMQAAAGQGGLLPGASGSPVLVNGRVVGHLKKVILAQDDPHAQLGVIYACPEEHVAALVPGQISIQRPASRDPRPPGSSYDPTWYVPRERQEKDVLQLLRFPGQVVGLWGPAHFGLKVFLEHIEHRLERLALDEGFGSVFLFVNPGGYSNDVLKDADGFFREFAEELAQRLGVNSSTVDRAWSLPASPTRKLRNLMESAFLPKAGDGRLVLALAGLGSLWSHPVKDDFMALLRSFKDRAGHQEKWQRLSLILATSVEPNLLCYEDTRSPFAMAEIVRIEELESKQIRSLATLYDPSWSDSDIEPLIDWMAGHPYLLARAMYEAVLHGRSLEDVADNSLDDNGPFAGHINFLRSWLDNHDLIRQQAIAMANEMDSGMSLKDFHTAYSTGLVRESGHGRYRIRNKFYVNLLKDMT